MSSGGIQRRRRMGPGPAMTADSADLRFPGRVRNRRTHKKVFIESSAAERRNSTGSQLSQCYTTCSNLDPKHKRVHLDHLSDFSETTVESVTTSSDGGSVCNDDSADYSTSVISLQLQMQELFSISRPYYLDSTDKLIKLPDDLIREVLRRLTVKEIVRIGCLNRIWRSEMQRLITDEHFNYM